MAYEHLNGGVPVWLSFLPEVSAVLTADMDMEQAVGQQQHTLER
jgi:hypothetical protein